MLNKYSKVINKIKTSNFYFSDFQETIDTLSMPFGLSVEFREKNKAFRLGLSKGKSTKFYVHAFYFWIESSSVNNVLLEVGIVEKNTSVLNENSNEENYLDVIKELKEIDISKEDEFTMAIQLLNTYIENFVLPFFKEYPDLQAINDKILEKVEYMKYGKYIPGDVIFKTLIIKKICTVEAKYIDYKKYWNEKLLKFIREDNDPKDQIFYNQFKRLINYLDSGKYKEVLAPNYTTSEIKAKVQEVEILKRPEITTDIALRNRYTKERTKFLKLGIRIATPFELKDFRVDSNWNAWELDTKVDKDFQYYLFLFIGTKCFNYDSQQYEAVSNDAYYFNAEWDGFVDYGALLNRLNLLTGNQLPISDVICEDDGAGELTFQYENKVIKWEFEVDSDWTDLSFFRRFLSLLPVESEQQFYIHEAGQGGVVLYLYAEQKTQLEDELGIALKQLGKLLG